MERFSLPNTVCVGVKYSLLHHAKDDVTITSQKMIKNLVVLFIQNGMLPIHHK